MFLTTSQQKCNPNIPVRTRGCRRCSHQQQCHRAAVNVNDQGVSVRPSYLLHVVLIDIDQLHAPLPSSRIFGACLHGWGPSKAPCRPRMIARSITCSFHGMPHFIVGQYQICMLGESVTNHELRFQVGQSHDSRSRCVPCRCRICYASGVCSLNIQRVPKGHL